MPAGAAAFEAVLYPNGPMSAKGFRWVCFATLTVSSSIATGFWLAGAWPVAGIMGPEIALFVVFFAKARRAARCFETIRLDAEGLHIRAVDARGRARAWSLEPCWTKVHMDDPPQRGSRLIVAARAERVQLGRFLTPEEKLDLACALRRALHDHRPF